MWRWTAAVEVTWNVRNYQHDCHGKLVEFNYGNIIAKLPPWIYLCILTLQLILIGHCKHGEYCELIRSDSRSSSCLWCDRTCQFDTYGCWESGHGCPKYGDVRSVQIEPHPFLTSLDNLPKKNSQLCHYLVVICPCLQVESCYSKRSTRQVSSIPLHPRTLSFSFSRSISFFLSILLVFSRFLSFSHSLSFYLFSIHLFTLSTVGITAFISFFSQTHFSLSLFYCRWMNWCIA